MDPSDSNANASAARSVSANNGSSQRDPSSSKHSPVVPLAPLEYLQNQRRGSITDPSLHAAPLNSNAKSNQIYRQQPEQSGTSSGASPYHDSSKTNLSDPRPSSPYVFGDATAQPVLPTDTNSQLRKLLRSPSLDHHSNHRSPPSLSHDVQGGSRNVQGLPKEQNQMNVDNERQAQQNIDRRNHQQPFDYNMRRHSVAGLAGLQNQQTLPHLSSLSHGTKRKMSGDRGVFPPVGEEIDPQLVGPGVPSGMDVDADAPAPKRRGSTFDTRPMAHLSLSDRRNSVDTRGGISQLWPNDRRDSASSIFSNVSSIGGFNPVFPSGDSPQTRAPSNMAAFSWQATTQPTDPNNSAGLHNEGEPHLPNNSRPFDPAAPMGSMMPPMNFVPDRRMSVPDTLTSSGPSRVLRSRSRPPSRQTQHAESNPHSGPSSSQEDGGAASSPGASSKAGKEPGATPYSRSPELRVSHKLAERKRRKEMKDLFDELRDQLPADRGMKASKWEILSKAIDFVAQLKQSHQDMAREIDMLRHEVEAMRQAGNPAFPIAPPAHPAMYGQVPPVPGQFPPPPGSMHLPHPPPIPPIHPGSRPGSSQNMFPPGANPPPAQNGNVNRPDGPPT